LTAPSNSELSEVAGRRSRSYWLLAQCFGDVPTPELLGELQCSLASGNTGVVVDEDPLAAQTGDFIAALNAAVDNEACVEPLTIEFTRLFSGISKFHGIPPFESVAREGSWGGDTVVDLLAIYAQRGISPPLPLGAPPDHLSVELRFLSIACYHEAVAWAEANIQLAVDWLVCERDFLDQHVLHWVPDYCDKMASLAQMPLYQTLLALTPLACRVDRADIDTIIDVATSAASKT
jgi:TorA maturation chaperone TorD